MMKPDVLAPCPSLITLYPSMLPLLLRLVTRLRWSSRQFSDLEDGDEEEDLTPDPC